MAFRKTMYNFDISETDNGYLVFEGDKLLLMAETWEEVDLWLDDHATYHGLSPKFYKLNFLPKPLKSTEILEKVQKICGKVQSFENITLDISAIHKFSSYVVELRKLRLEISTTQETADNFVAIENAIITLDFFIESWEAMIGYVVRKYI